MGIAKKDMYALSNKVTTEKKYRSMAAVKKVMNGGNLNSFNEFLKKTSQV